jgi:hypothetical protein
MPLQLHVLRAPTCEVRFLLKKGGFKADSELARSPKEGNKTDAW